MAVVEHGAVVGDLPGTDCFTLLALKAIIQTIDGLGAHGGITVSLEIMPAILEVDPAGHSLVVQEIHPAGLILIIAGITGVGFTAGLADQLSVYRDKAVAGSRDDRAPIHDGTTAVVVVTFGAEVLEGAAGAAHADGATGIAGCGAGGRLVLNSGGGVDMPAPLVLAGLLLILIAEVILGADQILLRGESIGGIIGVANGDRGGFHDDGDASHAVGVPNGVRSQDHILILIGRIIRDQILPNRHIRIGQVSQ